MSPPTPPILLVEDNPDDAELALMALEAAGVEDRVCRAVDGVDALEFLRAEGRHAGRDPDLVPALVLLDLKLPRMGGHEVLHAIREDERTKHVPVVVVSASSETSDLVRAYHTGANSFYQKPVDFRSFQTAFAMLVHYWTGVNTLTTGRGPIETGQTGAVLHAYKDIHRALDTRPRVVLVVEADTRDRDLTTEALQRSLPARSIGVVADGEKAYTYLTAQNVCAGRDPWACPHLVLLSDHAGRTASEEILRSVRAQIDHRATVVVLTRSPSDAEILEYYRAGANSVVAKPESPEAFKETVEFLAEYWLRLNVVPPVAKLPEGSGKPPS